MDNKIGKNINENRRRNIIWLNAPSFFANSLISIQANIL